MGNDIDLLPEHDCSQCIHSEVKSNGEPCCWCTVLLKSYDDHFEKAPNDEVDNNGR